MRLNTAGRVLTRREQMLLRYLGSASESGALAASSPDPDEAADQHNLAREYWAMARLT